MGLLPAVILSGFLGCASQPSPVSTRNDFPLDPREGLAAPFPRAVETGWEALAAGDAAAALEQFAVAPIEAAAPAAAIGRLQANLLLDRNAEAARICDRILPSAPRTVPLLASCGEAEARVGRRPAGLALYREALTISPGREGLQSRAENLRVAVTEDLLRDASARAAAGDTDSARRLYREAVELDPASSRTLAAAAAFELASGSRPKALDLYRQALDRDPSSP
ncbi:MAG TPA: tetratricopeptide repeat protein, partial [Thermoanaerobaculia bacterium]